MLTASLGQVITIEWKVSGIADVDQLALMGYQSVQALLSFLQSLCRANENFLAHRSSHISGVEYIERKGIGNMQRSHCSNMFGTWGNKAVKDGAKLIKAYSMHFNLPGCSLILARICKRLERIQCVRPYLNDVSSGQSSCYQFLVASDPRIGCRLSHCQRLGFVVLVPSNQDGASDRKNGADCLYPPGPVGFAQIVTTPQQNKAKQQKYRQGCCDHGRANEPSKKSCHEGILA